MKRSWIIWQSALTVLLLVPPAGAADGAPDERFQGIIQRNPFGLKAPPEPSAVQPAPPPPAVTVKLTGITTILARKRVLLQITELGKPPQAVVLKEGEKEGIIEVRNIDEKAGVVKILNGDREMELNFDKDGVKPPTAPAAAGGSSVASSAASGTSSAPATAVPRLGTAMRTANSSYFLNPSAPTGGTTDLPGIGGVAGGGIPAAATAGSIGFRFNGPATLNYQNPQPAQAPVSGRQVSLEEIALQHEISTAAIEEYAKRKGIPAPPRLPTPWSEELYGNGQNPPGNTPTPPAPPQR